MDISHDNIDFGPQIPFLGFEGLIRFLDPQKNGFSCSMLNSRTKNILYDHTDFGPQIPFLGSEG
jgi:hypothetical protein